MSWEAVWKWFSLSASVNFSERSPDFDHVFVVSLYCEVSCRQLLMLLETSSRVLFVAIPSLSLALCRLENGYCFFIQVLGPNSTANSIMAAYQQKRMVTPVVQGWLRLWVRCGCEIWVRSVGLRLSKCCYLPTVVGASCFSLGYTLLPWGRWAAFLIRFHFLWSTLLKLFSGLCSLIPCVYCLFVMRKMEVWFLRGCVG